MTNLIFLVVDDSPDILELFQILIDRLGYDCYTAFDYKTAREVLNLFPISILITDINMPGNGKNLISHVSKDFPNILISVVTGGDPEKYDIPTEYSVLDKNCHPIDIVEFIECQIKKFQIVKGKSE